jgi:hypothetical protein
MKEKVRAASISAPTAVKPGKDDVNWLNIGLMVAACGAAIAAPFQVFLCAWAILGPLHYLTEISWLHDRNYFTRRNMARRWWLMLVIFAVLTIGFAYAANDPLQRNIPVPFQVALIYLVFAAAAAAIFVRDWLNAVGLFLILSVGLFYFSRFQNYAVAANLLVTIVHVFLFTGAFILLGALKSKSWVAVASLAVFVACAIATVAVTAPYAAPSERVQQLYTSFEYLNRELLRLSGRPASVYGSAGVGVMRLIAFAYLYHYLNWFSKTSIIKWHEITRTRAAAIGGVWLAGGLAYLYDYRLGFGILYILSMLHVFLEFPLNHQTLVEIGKSLGAGRWWTVGTQRGLSAGTD